MGCDIGEMCGPPLLTSIPQLTPQLSREARRHATRSLVGVNVVREQLLATVQVEALARMIEEYADLPGILRTTVDVYEYLQVQGLLRPSRNWYGTYLTDDIHLLNQHLGSKLTSATAEQLKRIMTRHGHDVYLNLPYSQLSSRTEALWWDLRRHYITTMGHGHNNYNYSSILCPQCASDDINTEKTVLGEPRNQYIQWDAVCMFCGFIHKGNADRV
jgi:hypothetical protein